MDPGQRYKLDQYGTEINRLAPDDGANAVVGDISQRELAGAADPTVAIVPSREDGIPFLEENTAWGSSVSGRIRSLLGCTSPVMYVARVKEIMPASEAALSRSLESSTGDQAVFDQNTRVGVFEPESLYELSDLIPLATRVPYGLRYTDSESFWTAETTDDIL